MPDPRIHQSIADRCDLYFPRRPHPLRRWRRWSCWACSGAAILFLAWKAWQGDQGIYQSEPVALVHHQFRDDCSRCHQVPFQSLRMLLGSDAFARDVEDNTCLTCHDQVTHDHHPDVLANRLFGCFSCHREHAGEHDLARVEDAYCVACHRDLRTDGGPSGRFSRSIDSFASHPEFAVHGQPRALIETAGDLHGVHSVAKATANGQHWSDASSIRFPHDKHLHPDGVLLPPSHALAQGEEGRSKVLECASCHQQSEDGRYMNPIVYERHCAECHPLVVSQQLLGPIPHEDPELIQGTLRERLLNYAKQFPQAVDGQRINESRLPNRPAREPSPRDIWTWAEEQLSTQSEKKTLSLAQRIEWVCAYCHVTTPAPGENKLLPFAIEPPRIPTRWLTHAKFRHDRHDVRALAGMDCDDCHAARQSSSAADVLLPTVATCQNCHAPSSRIQPGGARHDCVECHDYHANGVHPGLPESSNSMDLTAVTERQPSDSGSRHGRRGD